MRVAIWGLIGVSMTATPALAIVAASGPSPVQVAQYSAYDVYTPGPSRFDVGAIVSAGGSASATLSPTPTVRADASGKWAFHSELRYFYTISGAAGTVVPLIAYTSLGASQTPGTYSYASASIDFYGQNQDSVYPHEDRYSGASQSFSGAFHITALTGVEGSVWLRADADIDNGGSASAFADPTIIIDPAFAATDPGYLSHFPPVVQPGRHQRRGRGPGTGGVGAAPRRLRLRRHRGAAAELRGRCLTPASLPLPLCTGGGVVASVA